MNVCLRLRYIVWYRFLGVKNIVDVGLRFLRRDLLYNISALARLDPIHVKVDIFFWVAN